MKECPICHKKMPAHILDPHMAKRHADAPKVEEAKPEPVVDSVPGGVVQSVVFDKVIIFCPKFFMSPDKENELLNKGLPVEKKPTPNIIRDIFMKMQWSIKRNEIKVFEKNVGEYLLSKFGFLIRVAPHEIDKYRKIQADKEYKCHVCLAEKKIFETDTLVAFQQHMRAHNMSPEAMAMIQGMEAAKPDGEVYTAADAAQGKPQTDQYDGAPIGGTYNQPMVDADGVEWVGPGSVKQQGMKLRPKFGAAGIFRGGI